MRKSLIVFVAALTALAMVAPAAAAGATPTAVTHEEPTCEYPLELEDATGETVTIEAEPDSVVAMGPSDAQTVFEIGAEEKVVGMPVGPSTDYLDADEDLDVTGDDGVTVDPEKVVASDPDVVLAANVYENRDEIDTLRDAGLTVYVFPPGESLHDVRDNVALTGEIVGECDGAQETIEWMDERLEIIENAVEGEERPLGYYAMTGGWTTGEDTFGHEILTTAGLENLPAEVGLEGWTEINEEVVVEEDPDWIVYGDAQEEPPVPESVAATTAYQNEQFVAVNSNYMDQPGPRVVYAIEEIVEAVHPDAYAAAEAELQATDDPDDAGDDAADDGDEVPGFGVPVAVAALLAALFVRTRGA